MGIPTHDGAAMFIDLPSELEEALIDVGLRNDLPAWSVEGTFLADFTIERYRAELGAGASILSDARAAVSRLTPSGRALLADVAYRYGSFFELSDVGEEYKPFPVLDGEPADLGFVRSTAKMPLAESGLDEEHAHAAKELTDQLAAGQVSFTLQHGDVLIVNQHHWVHGREPLGDGQADVAPEDRRLLLQLFLRSAKRHRPRRLVGGAG